ncbi:glycoside hydrolase family 6 protein [Allorhizocola rhizosphaerae]|uniref:glycoside hydrolase family 6 protein n=1 Tax=Allorhizocola rhizosphaerae TaxID=1872709 RepID=UPI000E3E0DAD|nr:glycoside hydrolase family 6 protein [Allorhizocola rhizosphaerae]
MTLPIRQTGRRLLACAGISALVSTAVVVAPAQPAHAAVVCAVTYQKSWDNGSGFGAGVTIRNLGDPIASWTLTFTFPGNQRIVDSGWSANWRQDGPNVTATSMPWNGNLGANASTAIGFNGTYSGANTDPVDFAINGVPCSGTPRPPTPVVTPTSVFVPEGGNAPVNVRLSGQPASNMTVLTTAGSGDTDLTVCSGGTLLFTAANWSVPQQVRVCAAEDADSVNGTRTFSVGGVPVVATESDNDPPAAKVDNPFAGAAGYVNPDWRGQVEAQAATVPEPLAGQMRAVGQQSTAIWLDRIGAITAGRGLAGHLDAAVAQDAANGTAPVVVSLVLYNLPNRNCQAFEGSSELTLQGGLARYRSEYIDAIAAILARPEYAALRVAVVVEPWSLYSHVVFEPPTQHTTLRCSDTHRSGVYRDGIRYAVGRLSAVSNTYLYVDISNSGWLGWETNLHDAVNLYDHVLATASGGPGYGRIHGFATNVAGYVPIEEVFLPDPRLIVSGTSIFQTRWIDWNDRVDERDYVAALLAEFATRGCVHCGMLIDTSRNGWGGPARPERVSTSTNPDTYVNESRLDRRLHRTGWCNQAGAGIGARPTADTGIPGVDAFVWAKPPGESDGAGSPSTIDPDDPHKMSDPMCDPLMRNRYEDEVATGALPGGPHFGRWFPAQFEQLVRNAHP